MRNGLWLLVTGCLAVLCGCEHHGQATPPGGASQPPEVSVDQPTQKTLHYIVEQPGRIEPFEQTPIYAKIAGYVSAVHVDIGFKVKKGDLLAELKVPELVEQHRRKEALVAQARLGIAQAEQAERVVEKSLELARAEIEVAKADRGKAAASLLRWESESQRMEQMVRSGALDKGSSEEVRNQASAARAAQAGSDARVRSAEAALAEAEERCKKARIDREAAHNQLTVAEAEERELKEMLQYTRITAPYDGVVADRRVHTGHFKQSATADTKGEPLFVIVRTDKVRVFVEVPEADAIRVHKGSPARIRVQALNDLEFTGEVAGDSFALDPTQRTLRTEMDFDNPDGLLRPGNYVHALIEVERPKAWVVPVGSVVYRDGLNFCYQVRDGKTHRLALRPGLRDGKYLEVLKFQQPPRNPGEQPRWVNPSGQEAIVVNKAGELIDNQTVQIKDKASAE